MYQATSAELLNNGPQTVFLAILESSKQAYNALSYDSIFSHVSQLYHLFSSPHLMLYVSTNFLLADKCGSQSTSTSLKQYHLILVSVAMIHIHVAPTPASIRNFRLLMPHYRSHYISPPVKVILPQLREHSRRLHCTDAHSGSNMRLFRTMFARLCNITGHIFALFYCSHHSTRWCSY